MASGAKSMDKYSSGSTASSDGLCMKRVETDSRHDYVCDIVASYLKLDKREILDHFLRSNQISILASLFLAGGPLQIIVTAPAETEGAELSGDELIGERSSRKSSKVNCLIITSTDDEDDGPLPCLGTCVYFVRCNNQVAILEDNVATSLTCGLVQAGQQQVLTYLRQQIELVVIPSVSSMEGIAQGMWGELNQYNRRAEGLQKSLLASIHALVATIGAAEDSVMGTVTFPRCPLDVQEKVQSALTRQHVLLDVNTHITMWIQCVQKVIIEGDAVRQDSDSMGPTSELQYWKTEEAKLGALLVQIECPETGVKAVMTSVCNIRPRRVKMWKQIERRLFKMHAIASSNVRFLQVLDKHCSSLYLSNPAGIVESLPEILGAMQMIYRVSDYFQQPDKIASLIIKVTNQIIIACKEYVRSDIDWRVLSELALSSDVHDRLRLCLRLSSEYLRQFRTLQDRIQELDNSPMNFSRVLAFGKLMAASKRFEDVIALMDIIRKHTHLLGTSIEGLLEPDDRELKQMNGDFTEAVNYWNTISYDVLDHQRVDDFRNDFQEFQKRIDCIQTQLVVHLTDRLAPCWSMAHAISTLRRLENLQLSNYPVDDRKLDIINATMERVRAAAKQYETHKNDPPVDRNMPPISGKMKWAMGVLSSLEYRIMSLKNYANLLDMSEARLLVHCYNQVAKTLYKFCVLYHSRWSDRIIAVHSLLDRPLLARLPTTRQLYVNYHLDLVLSEGRNMMAMGFPLPPAFRDVFKKTIYLKTNRDSLLFLVEKHHRLKHRIPAELQLLFTPQLATVDKIVDPGLSLITWASLNVDTFVNNFQSAINDLEILVDRVNSLFQCRIKEQLESLKNTVFVHLPRTEPFQIEELLKQTKLLCMDSVGVLTLKNKSLEEAANDLLDLLQDNLLFKDDSTMPASSGMSTDSEEIAESASAVIERGDDARRRRSSVHPANFNRRRSTIANYGRPESFQRHRIMLRKRLRDAAVDVLGHYSSIYVDMYVDVVKDQLGDLYEMLVPGRSNAASIDVTQKCGVIWVEADLSDSKIVIRPSLPAVQDAMKHLTDMIVTVFKAISVWSRRKASTVRVPPVQAEANVTWTPDVYIRPILERPYVLDVTHAEKNYHSAIANNPEVSRIISLLNTIADGSLSKDIGGALKRFEIYDHLWTQDLNQCVKDFLDGFPSLAEVESRVLELQEEAERIRKEEQSIAVGGIIIQCGNLKGSLQALSHQWLSELINSCKDKYRREMDELLTSMGDLSRRLSRPIRDLDDIRFVMNALREVREIEVDTELRIVPIEECYAMIGRLQWGVLKEESEKVDNLRYNWQKLRAQSTDVGDLLQEIYPHFHNNLQQDILTFASDCDVFYVEYTNSGPIVPDLPPKEAYDRLLTFQNRLEVLWRRFQTIGSGEELFGMSQSEHPELSRIRKEINLLQKLYKLYGDVTSCVRGYYATPWSELDIESINNELLEFQNRCRKLPKGLKEWPAFHEAKKIIDDFNELCPLLELMANKAMKLRHWKRIADVMNYPLDVDNENCTLKSVLDAPLLKFKEDIEDICISAVKEKDIEAKLKLVTNEWEFLQLSFSTFKNRGELLLRGDSTAEVVAKMEDSLVVLGSLLNNRYNGPFRKKIHNWVTYLSSTSEVLEKWLLVQNLWVYLEAVFVGGDIANQLPKEAARFYTIDKSWQKVMQRAHEVPNVVQCCVGDEVLKQILPHLEQQLELCQRSLSGYLEKKRFIFPRFFFVSDPALLEILGQSSDSHTIQAHLLSIFDNTKSVMFHELDYDRIIGVVSSEGEQIRLERPVRAAGSVELWLTQLLKTSQQSMHSIIRQAAVAINEPSFKLLDFLANFPAQVGILGLQMVWTRDAETAILGARQDRKIMFETNNRFLDMLNALIEQTTRDLQHFERVKCETLITIHVHQRDIFDQLCRAGIRSLTDFEWQKQCRFYFKEETDKTLISITDVTFVYQNEFLGCTDRLVITPLTDRCYITLAQALRMSMGGCSTGPAGTGKTETVKDMGKTLGKYVVLFNCSDQMDYRGLGRIFKGLAQSGSWGCFDEFNRIELPVLSVAAQQIACLLLCKKEHRKQFTFTDGDTVHMNTEFGVFLTMNPGYAGRKELPENLKIQFRTVAMMVPDRQIIIRVKLASCGFLENITLARKFYALYKLCEEQLSKQVHYDFGLRNILSVLRTLGSAKKANSEESETTIVMRVLRDMNLSKLVDEDEPLFMSLINDLFPNHSLDKVQYPQLEEAIRNQVELAGLVYHEQWVLKIIQLYETQEVRHGIMTLGPSGSGKTTCIQILMKAMTECGAPHRELRLNPKALTSSQMFGKLDVATNDWTDGVFAALWRKTLKPANENDHTWLVLDGPVDSMWIENLNSVLDDNRMLTLVNGDRIPMAATCKVIFEAHNIDNASPATVSRNGMVYMSSSVLGWKPIVQAWIRRSNPRESEFIMKTFENVFPGIYQWSTQTLTFQIEILECNVVNQILTLLEGLLNDVLESTNPLQEDVVRMRIMRVFVFCIMWSIGALLETGDRQSLEIHLRTLADESVFDLPPLSSTSDTIFNYMVDTNGEWVHWESKTESFICPELSSANSPDYGSILVPHIDSVRTDFLVHTVAKQGKAVLLLGAQGTGKSVILKSYMKKYNTEVHLGKMVNFSSATTPFQFQKIYESLLEKRAGTTYGPPGNRRMTLFIDDLSLPMYNEWGDQPANEIVRQAMEMDGFYSLEKPGEFLGIIDVQFLAAMMQPGGGRNDIPSRLKRFFTIINCTLPSDECIDKIFGVIGSGHYCSKRGFPVEVQDFVHKLIPITRVLWQKTKDALLPTPANFHYVFNLRDLSRIWQGMVGTLSNVITNRPILISLWKHECCRVIADRFTTAEDYSWFNETLIKVVEEHLGHDYVPMVTNTDYYVDFLRDAPEPTGEEGEELDMEQPKVYEPIESFESLRERLNMFLTQYNEMVRGSGMDLVFFQDAMIHLVKVSRIIRSPGGNALLVGVGGSGKQSLSKLASFIAGYKTFQITLTRSYGLANLLEDLKVLFRTTGSQGKGTTFIFSEQDIKEEAFLEYMNSLLSAGTVYNLFSKEDQNEIIAELTPIMKREFPRRSPTPENVIDFFATRIYQNLHVVLCFSPVGEKFRNRCLKFPGLVSGCTMDWYQPWPRDALVAVSSHLLADFQVICTPEIKQQLILCMGSIQEDVSIKCSEYYQRYRRSFYVTPKSYLTFLNSYRSLYSDRRKEINQFAERMESGLAKLQEASESVARLKVELDVMEHELAAASDRAETVLLTVTERAREAEEIRNQVRRSAHVAQLIVDEISVEKAMAECKLEAARPALAEAEAALNTIKPAHIATVRKLGRPPHLIMRVMDCVLLLFQRRVQLVRQDPVQMCPKPSWPESLKMMSHTNFLQMLQTFPKDTINDETVEFLQPYITMDDYNMETARRVCGDVAGLLSWTKAMVVFYDVNKEVLPLKANLAVQESRLRLATHELQSLEGELTEKETELGQVKMQYEDAVGAKQKLANETTQCRHKMNTASMLISGLAGEKIRWTEESKAFKEQLGRLVGDVLLSTAFLSYAGPFNQQFRNVLLRNWQKEVSDRSIPATEETNVLDMLMDASLVAEWSLQGLPGDELSIQNGVIVSKAACYPLLIDPQGQGESWIKNKEAKNELQITSLSHKYFRTHLEDSLSLGRPLLIEDVSEELDPILDNLLEKNFIKSGTTLKVMLGDKECDVMPGFSVHITTKLSNPQYAPEVSAKTTLVDFAVTTQGLEEQLLGRVILSEKSELEHERVRLMEAAMENKRLMKHLEDSLLLRLTSTKGSLVDDEDLLQVLQKTKATALTVSEKLKVAAETEEKINAAREEFRPVAVRGSILYFLIVELTNVNCMYQTSLRQFLALFDWSLAHSEKIAVTSERIFIINREMTRVVFHYVSRGLYERHRFLFALLLALKIDVNSGKISHDEFTVLIKGGASLDLRTVQQKPFPWILDVTWLNLVQLGRIPLFSELLSQVVSNEENWKTWLDLDAPEEADVEGYEIQMNAFHRLLLIRSWSPDRTLSQAKKYVTEALGAEYSRCVLLDLDAMWRESDCCTPLVCLLSTGSDPTELIEAQAKKNSVELKIVSMGQGQEVISRRLLSLAMAQGSWILLQNCHLSLHFCDEIVDTLVEASNVHQSFRIWVTTEPHPNFSIGLLQMAIKFTNEPPQGIRNSLRRIYGGISQDLLDYTRLRQWQPLLYALSFLHTVLQERRKYGLGWNIPYDFNQADFGASTQVIQNLLDDMDPRRGVSWVTISYMVAEVQYGGRVTDEFDKRLLKAYTDVWFTEDLFNRNFLFYLNYGLPRCTVQNQYLEFVDGLPGFDSPEVFGLHPNAGITYQITAAQEILDTVVNMQPKDSGSTTAGNETREAVVYRLAQDMLNKLPPDYVSFEVKEKLQQMGAVQPMNIFLRLEIGRMQKVLSAVRSDLQDLRLAIEGTIIMTESLRSTLDAIYDARVPATWEKISWESNTLGFWFTELMERNGQFVGWLNDGRPVCFWMTGFFNPQGFLTAMRQEVTRLHRGWALDTVILQNTVTRFTREEITEAPTDGVYVYGLLLEAASWDRRGRRLAESQPKVLFEEMPVLHIYAVNGAANKDPATYECPVYKKPSRADGTYVCSLDLRTSVSPYHWIFRGVALLCDNK